MTLIVPDNGNVRFSLIKAAPKREPKPQEPKPQESLPDKFTIDEKDIRATLHLSITDSTSDEQQPARIGFRAEDDADRPAMSQTVTLKASDPSVEVALFAQGLKPGLKYKRLLRLTGKGVTDKSWTLEFVKPSAAKPKLHIDQNVITRNLTAGCRYASTEIKIALWETGDSLDVEGVRAWRDGASKSPKGSFVINECDEFLFNGEKVELFRSPAQDSERAIKAGDQAAIGINLYELPAGSHEFDLKFGAANIDEATAPSLKVKINVRHCIVWAGLWLFFASVVSYVMTKGVKNMRARRALRAEIIDLRKDWLRTLPKVLPVVTARAWLRQSLDLVDGRSIRHPLLKAIARVFGTSILVPLDRIRVRVNRAKKLVGVLQEYRQIEQQTSARDTPRVLQSRIKLELDDFLDSLDTDISSETADQQVQARLAVLQEWVTDRDNHYWKLVSKRVDRLNKEFKIDDEQLGLNDDQKTKLKKQWDEIKNEQPPANLDEMIARDEMYSRLRLLWKCRENKVIFDELLAHVLNKKTEKVFACADGYEWEHKIKSVIETENPEIRANMISPNNKQQPADPVEAFRPLRFSICDRNRQFRGNFVFKYGLECDWHFKLTNKSGELREWTETTKGPSIVHYAAQKGELEINAKLVYPRKNDRVDVGPAKLTVGPAHEFSAAASFQRSELVTFGLAGVIALISGLSLQYANNPTFGSLPDYLTLFLWGAGIDTGRNLIQSAKLDGDE